MMKSLEGLKTVLPVMALAFPAAGLAMLTTSASAQSYPSQPIELICTTSPGSGVARWCEMLAQELAKPEYLSTPINVVYMSGGSNHEPAVYVTNREADGYTLMHGSASFHSYFNLPFFTVDLDDFELLARFEQTVYGVGVLCSDPDLKSWEDVVEYARANPGELAMGSNKVGSTHHVQHTRIALDENGADIRFVPYEGTGDVVRDVVGGHLRLGFAQPGLWNPHIEAGTVCPLLILNEEKLDHPLWADVPSVQDAGMTYDIPHQWQGFFVKAGTPDEVMDTLAAALEKVTNSEAYAEYMEQNPHVVPAFNSDRAEIKADFEREMQATRDFLVEVGMLQ
jgi:putative tricarboxylic transport membrane protein